MKQTACDVLVAAAAADGKSGDGHCVDAGAHVGFGDQDALVDAGSEWVPIQHQHVHSVDLHLRHHCC